MPREVMAIAAGRKRTGNGEHFSYARDAIFTHTLITDYANTILQETSRKGKGRRGRGRGRLQDSMKVTDTGYGIKGIETEALNGNDGSYLLFYLGFAVGSTPMKVRLGADTTDDLGRTMTSAKDIKLKVAAGANIGELHAMGPRPRQRNPKIDEMTVEWMMVGTMLADLR